jgi:hypothetical protein
MHFPVLAPGVGLLYQFVDDQDDDVAQKAQLILDKYFAADVRGGCRVLFLLVSRVSKKWKQALTYSLVPYRRAGWMLLLLKRAATPLPLACSSPHPWGPLAALASKNELPRRHAMDMC